MDQVARYLEIFRELTSLHSEFLAELKDASALLKIAVEDGTDSGTQQLASLASATQSTAAGSVTEQTTYVSQEERSVYRTDKFSLQCRLSSPSFGKNLQSRR